MPLRFRIMVMAPALAALAGCTQVHPPLVQVDPTTPRPGLENLHAQTAPQAEAPAFRPAPPQPPPPESLPFPQGRLDLPQAEVLLAGDPMALRFLALKGLAAQGLIPTDEAARRRDTNLGALLPLTVTEPPAAGLDKPIPPVSRLLDEVAGLAAGQGRGTDGSRAAERDFLVERLLPANPGARQQWSPHDLQAARQMRERLGRLEDSGLITPEQRALETVALESLMASGTLPEMPPVALAPEPPKPAPKKAAGGSGGARMPGGVSGKLVVIPSPPSMTAPKLDAATKGPAGVHLLSMGTASHGDKAWEALKKEHAELAALGHTVSRADLGDLGVTYRLIAGPLSPAEADKLCATLKPRGQTCTPTPFPSQ